MSTSDSIWPLLSPTCDKLSCLDLTELLFPGCEIGNRSYSDYCLNDIFVFVLIFLPALLIFEICNVC